MTFHMNDFVHHKILKRQRDRDDDDEEESRSERQEEARESRRRAADDEDDEAESSTTSDRRATSTRGRSTPTESSTTESSSSETETSTTSTRDRRTSSTQSSTTSTTASESSTTTTSSTTTSTTSTTSSTSSTTTSSTPTTTSLTTSSVQTTSSPSSSTRGLASDAASSKDSDSSTSSAGPIAGGIAAAVVVALAIGGFILWKRRRAQKNRDNDGYLPNNSYDDDDRSFVGGRGESVVGPKFNEKYPSDAQAFNMQDMPSYNNNGYGYGGPGDMQQTGGYGAGSTAAAVGAYPGGEHGMQDPRYSQGFSHVRSSYDGQLYDPEGPHHPYAAGAYAAYANSPPVAPIAEGEEPYPATDIPSVFAAQHQGQDRQSGSHELPPPVPQLNEPASEEGPFADPQYVDKLFKVVRTFQPTMPDELPVNHGDRIKILVAYDDGWCLGENLDAARDGSANIRGVFPRDCVEEVVLGGTQPEAEQQRAPSPPVSDLNAPAPTLPPLDIGDRSSKTFDESSYNLPSPGVPESTTPTIEISDAAEEDKRQSADPHHLSSASSIQDSSVIDHFPEAPTGTNTRPMSLATLPGTSQKRYTLTDTPQRRQSMHIKRSSSLLAGRDADLFMALDRALENHPPPKADE